MNEKSSKRSKTSDNSGNSSKSAENSNASKSGEGRSRLLYGGADTMNAEFVYYSSILRTLAPSLTNDCDRQMIVPWVRKLFRPEYHSTKFREKRNKYLCLLAISLLNDEAYGLFRLKPPQGALADVADITHEPVLMAEWETDTMWQETLASLPDEFPKLACSVHEDKGACDADHALDMILDQEFQLLLFISRPYAALIKNKDDRTKVATWLQALCTIQGNYCSSMKGIRNDYMMALLGYIHDLRVSGPFVDYPPFRTLPSLAEQAKLSADIRPITDPYAPACTEFMSGQPIPNDGAFCYIAITGDLIKSTFEAMKTKKC